MEAAGEVQHFVHGLEYYADLATKVRGVYQPLPFTLGRSYGMVVRRPRRRLRRDRPFQLPPDVDRDEARAGSGCWQHDRAQALRGPAAHDAAIGGAADRG
jgi:hypothetical protein